jgi:hypothetical protein
MEMVKEQHYYLKSNPVFTSYVLNKKEYLKFLVNVIENLIKPII